MGLSPEPKPESESEHEHEPAPMPVLVPDWRLEMEAAKASEAQMLKERDTALAEAPAC